jgi:hypothetical protein
MPTLHIPVHHTPTPTERTPTEMATQTSEHTAQTAQVTTYHFVLTAQRQNGIASTRSDVLHLPAGTTRTQALDFLKDTYFRGENVAVLFFSLEPDQL